jgi:hypothetical protein
MFVSAHMQLDEFTKHVSNELHQTGVVNSILRHDLQPNLYLVATVCGVCFMQVFEKNREIIPVKTLYFTK